MTPQLWVRKVAPVAGDWIPGSPGELSGGLAMPALEGAVLFPTCAFAGDGSITANFHGGFAGTVPAGFLPGAPFANWDDARSQGSTITNAGLTASGGLAQTNAGMNVGSWYWELTVSTWDIFSEGFWFGVAVSQPDPPQYQAASGRFSSTNPNGGAGVKSGPWNTFQPTLFATGSSIAVGAYPALAGNTPGSDIVGLALFMSLNDSNARYVSHEIQPITLPCVPCCTLVMDCGWPPHRNFTPY